MKCPIKPSLYTCNEDYTSIHRLLEHIENQHDGLETTKLVSTLVNLDERIKNLEEWKNVYEMSNKEG